MIPLGDENPTFRTPVVTIGILVVLGLVWVFLQGGGIDTNALAASVCNLGLVAGEITRAAATGTAVPIGPGMACVVDADPINVWTPVTSMFLHGSWAHIIGNGLFLWVFGNNVEDSMGRLRFLGFYLLCGLAAAAAQVIADPSSPVPMVGASGAISGVMGGYLVLYPLVRVRMLFVFIVFFRVFLIPAWLVLLWWFAVQVLSAMPRVAGAQETVPVGVAFMAHIGGFVAGVALVLLFRNKKLVAEHRRVLRLHHQRAAWG